MKFFTASLEERAISKEAIDYFNEFGFVVVRGVLTDDICLEVANIIDEIAAKEREAGQAHEYGESLQRVWNLLNKHRIFHRLILSEYICSWMNHLFDRPTHHRKFFLSSFQANILDPGASKQKIHIDTPIPDPHPPYIIKANSIWMIDDFTNENGATQVVPRSHLLRRRPTTDEAIDHPDLVTVIAPRGSVLITHGALWHRSGSNLSSTKRRVLLGSFAASYAREIASEEDIVRCLSPETRDTMTNALFDMVGGYHGLKPGGLVSVNPTNVIRSNPQPYVLYGAGTLLDECWMQVIQIMGREPTMIIDNNPNRSFRGNICLGSSALDSLPKNIPIIISTRHHLPIAEQLREKGFSNVRHIIFTRARFNIQSIETHTSLVEVKDTLDSASMRGKTALITGSTRGIGFRIANALTELGVDVVIHGRIKQTVEIAKAKLAEKFGIKPKGIIADLANEEECYALAANPTLSDRPVDILYINAGVCPALDEQSIRSSWQTYATTLSVNFRPGVILTQSILPSMIRRGNGRIIYVTSSIKNKPESSHYICSKRALEAFIEEQSNRTEGTNVCLSSFDPGWIKTDMGGAAAPNDLETIIPGALIGALDIKLRPNAWITAQDFAGLTLSDAIKKATLDHLILQR